LKVPERSVVCILGSNSQEMFISMLGSICANNITAGINRSNNPKLCLYMLQHSGCEVCVVDTYESLRTKFLCHG
jgi:long-subunit acyl-CoA synthetase (AMP-forming)